MLIRILQQNPTLGLIQHTIPLTSAVDSDEKKNKNKTKGVMKGMVRNGGLQWRKIHGTIYV